MEVPYDESIASHIGPESCVHNRKAVREALTGESAGQVLSRESSLLRGAHRVKDLEGNTMHITIARYAATPRGLRPCARTEASRTGAGRSMSDLGR